jgi:hypothetical protein
VLKGLVRLFSYDAAMKSEMVHFLFPQVAEMTQTYLTEEMNSGDFGNRKGARAKGSNWTHEEGAMNAIIFGLLR